jgi:hypothetical protein
MARARLWLQHRRYFSGIAHPAFGWLWLVAAFLGVAIRPWFGLSVEAICGRRQVGGAIS